jgi:hypothetical protein
MTQTPMPAAATSAVVEPEPGLLEAIAAALPADPYEQLEVARKITGMAVAAQKASRFELDGRGSSESLQLEVSRLTERDRLAADLSDSRATKLEQALRDAPPPRCT